MIGSRRVPPVQIISRAILDPVCAVICLWAPFPDLNFGAFLRLLHCRRRPRARRTQEPLYPPLKNSALPIERYYARMERTATTYRNLLCGLLDRRAPSRNRHNLWQACFSEPQSSVAAYDGLYQRRNFTKSAWAPRPTNRATTIDDILALRCSHWARAVAFAAKQPDEFCHRPDRVADRQGLSDLNFGWWARHSKTANDLDRTTPGCQPNRAVLTPKNILSIVRLIASTRIR
jgi:hypothetical protein